VATDPTDVVRDDVLHWDGTLHIGRIDPIRVERQADGSVFLYTGCCQCRLIHELHVRRDGNALLFDFQVPDPKVAKGIENARLQAEDDQVQLLLQENTHLKSEVDRLERRIKIIRADRKVYPA